MAQPWLYNPQLERAQDLQNSLRICIEHCEPCAFRIRDVHNGIVDSIKPLIDAQQILLTAANQSTASLREIHGLSKSCTAHTSRIQAELNNSLGMQDIALELKTALDDLRSQPVDPAFIGGESDHTLYDFVDESSVHSLQQQLRSELGEMDAIYQSCFATIRFFEEQMQYMNNFLRDVLPVVYPSGSDDTPAVQSVGLLMNALKGQCSLAAAETVEINPLHVLMQNWKTYAMELEVSVVSLASSVSQAENLTSRLTSIRDRMQVQQQYGSDLADASPVLSDTPSSPSVAGTQQQSRVRSRTQSDSVTQRGNLSRMSSTDSNSEKIEEELRHLLTDLESCERTALERIRVGNVLADAWERRMQEVDVIRWCARATQNIQQSALQRIRGAALETDRIVQTTRERRKPFEDGIRRFQALNQSVASLRQELTSLSFFYKEFASAYTALREEMARRHQALSHLRAIAAEAQRAFDEYTSQETNRRGAFLDQYGQFLPVSLCPEVQDSPASFSVIPDISEALNRIPFAPPVQDPPSTEVASATESLALIMPIVRQGVFGETTNESTTSASVSASASAAAVGSEAAQTQSDIMHQPKPRRVMQTNLFGSEMPATMVFSPSPPLSASSPVEPPPFAISPAANPFPDLSQFLEALGETRHGASVSDIFHFHHTMEDNETNTIPDTSNASLTEPLPAAATAIAAAVVAQLPLADTSATDMEEENEVNGWVHFESKESI